MSENSIIKKVFITGITGSGGSYLAEYIYENHPEIEIHGIARWHSTTSVRNLEKIDRNLYVHECDLLDYNRVTVVILAQN